MKFYTRVSGIAEVYRTPLGGGGFVCNANTQHDVGFTHAFGPRGKPRGATPGQLSHIALALESERDLVELIAQGRDNSQIAAALTLSDKTVRNHITRIFSKLEVENRPQAIVMARKAGFGKRID